ncbi:hypothetical protein [Tropicimonas sp. IMCC6043]|uniref:hypothetical protein n=1 Tax=Tropicimonas sp. IMCC6043 TaxID=2510645 RepID=UPI00101CA875|nr:hypothetical protein [Tropicimonas sp. IMCC6043]RYH09035.1 hypothetical protein EU800_13730 [Tropicimonas sp. IMCC6043]
MRREGLWLASALFYAAPVGAGLSGASYFAALPFAALFLLWVLVMRAEPFRDGAAFVLPTLVLHVALASMLLGFGQLLRALLGVEAQSRLSPWLAMGLGGVALGRLLWQPKKEAEIEFLIEIALKKLNDFADDAEEILEQEPDLPLSHPTEAEAAALAQAIGKLDALAPEGAPEAALRRYLRPLEREVRAHVLLDAVLARAEASGTRRDRQAALLLATNGPLAWSELGRRRVAAVFDLIVAAADVPELARFLTRAPDLLAAYPATVQDFPAVPRLLDIADQIEASEPDLAEALVQLAHDIEDLGREPEDG